MQLRSIILSFGLILTVSVHAQTLFTAAGVNSGGNGISEAHHDGTNAMAQGVFNDLNGYAHAEVNYGSLHTYAHAMNTAGNLYSWASAQSMFTDQLTITGGTGTGYFIADFKVDGTLQANYSAFSNTGLYWSNMPSGIPGNVQGGNHTYQGTTAIPFTYGVPFDFYAQMISNVIFVAGGFGEGLADFSNTAKLTATHVYDPSFNPVGGTTITSASGHFYPQAVPEPAPFAVLGVGTITLLRRRTKRS